MIVLWLLDAAIAVLGWLLDLFPHLPTFTYPDPLSVTVPVPYLGGYVSYLNAWFGTALPVVSVLILGRVLQALYRLIPYKAA